ncbi:MAG: molecular chaperone TorD family protein [Planctomycetia bacterium]|nr:molecular chaperone TorD family protein [Planctomycetia bacterium]
MSANPAAADGFTAETRDALTKAADLRLIGLLFERPSESRRRHVAALGAECADAGLRELAMLMTDVDEGSYQSVFGSGGPVSPRQAAYIGRRDPARAMAELSELYGAFGFTPSPGEPLDHVATEAGFAAFLYMKEAYAVSQGNTEAAEITAAARKTFVEDHLRLLANGLLRRLGDAPEALQKLAAALVDRVGTLAEEEDLDTLEPEEEMSCGLPPDQPS